MEKKYYKDQFENDAIFKYLNPDENTMLSSLKGLDVQELVILIDEFYLSYRKFLGFPKSVTFGLELEFEKVIREIVEDKLRTTPLKSKWIIKGDSSLNCGAEVNSPILRDNKCTWKNLDILCSILQKEAIIGTKSGGHVHVGTQTLGSEKTSWLNFIKLWSVYENILFRFSYGEFLISRPKIQNYAKPFSNQLWDDYQDLSSKKDVSVEGILSRISHCRYQAVNFYNVIDNRCNIQMEGNTIEFRCPNGSLNPIVWQNNVNCFVRMLQYAKSSSFDDDKVTKRHEKNVFMYDNLSLYRDIYLEQALEFADMIFDNNFDKVYFLRQYLKSYEVTRKKDEYSKARVLSKKGN